MAVDKEPDMVAGRVAQTRAVQRAAGVIAARHRRDLPGAQALLAEFADDDDKAFAFFQLAELALALVCGRTGQTMDQVIKELTLFLAHTVDDPAPPT